MSLGFFKLIEKLGNERWEFVIDIDDDHIDDFVQDSVIFFLLELFVLFFLFDIFLGC